MTECPTVEYVNEILKKAEIRVDKIGRFICGNDFTSCFLVHVVDQNFLDTENFSKKFPIDDGYNNVIHWAIGYPHIIVRYKTSKNLHDYYEWKNCVSNTLESQMAGFTLSVEERSQERQS